MIRRYSIALQVLVMVAATATLTARAQSGRGRQLRIQGTLHKESVGPEATEAQVKQQTPGGSESPLILSQRSKGLIYNDAAANQKKDDGEYHMTKADKRASWILLGFLVLEVAVIAMQD